MTFLVQTFMFPLKWFPKGGIRVPQLIIINSYYDQKDSPLFSFLYNQLFNNEMFNLKELLSFSTVKPGFLQKAEEPKALKHLYLWSQTLFSHLQMYSECFCMHPSNMPRRLEEDNFGSHCCYSNCRSSCLNLAQAPLITVLLLCYHVLNKYYPNGSSIFSL